MKFITTFILTMLLSISCFATLIPSDEGITVGGRVFTKAQIAASTFKVLYGYATTSGNTGLFEELVQTAYVVPASTTFRILAISMSANTSGATSVNIYYTDDALTAITATVGTNPVYHMGNLIAETIGISATAGSPRTVERAVNIPIPTGKFPNANGNGADDYTIIIYGIEEAA